MRGPGGTVLGHWSRRRKTLSWVDPQQRARTPVTEFKGVGTRHPGKEHKARMGRSLRVGASVGWQPLQRQGHRPGPSAGHAQELHREQSGPETYTHSKQLHRIARHPVLDLPRGSSSRKRLRTPENKTTQQPIGKKQAKLGRIIFDIKL